MFILDVVHQLLCWCGISSVDPALTAEVVLRLGLVLESSANLDAVDGNCFISLFIDFLDFDNHFSFAHFRSKTHFTFLLDLIMGTVVSCSGFEKFVIFVTVSEYLNINTDKTCICYYMYL